MAHPMPTIKSSRNGQGCRRSGFTLIEAMIASTIVAVAVIGVAGLMASSAGQAQYAAETANAIALGRQLMEEIAAKPLIDPTDGSRTLGAEAGETSRTLFDNVDDYHGYLDATTAIKTATGDWYVLGDGQKYERRVRVQYLTSPSGPADPNGDFALVTVTITTPGATPVVLKQIMTKGNLKM